jgi:hypothetical protein
VALGSDAKKQQKAEEVEELLDALEKLVDRTKVLFEQYFMGIQKVAPMQLHRDIERRVRDLTQLQIRNTGLRFRFTTLSQKFGSYNTYWKRTLREIEQGKYVRDLVRVKRKAEAAGEELPEELLVKLPKLVQDRIRRDRSKMAERAVKEGRDPAKGGRDRGAAAADATRAEAAIHALDEDHAAHIFSEGDLDMDDLFGALTSGDGEPEPAPPSRESAAAIAPPSRPEIAPPKPESAAPTAPPSRESAAPIAPPKPESAAPTAPPSRPEIAPPKPQRTTVVTGVVPPPIPRGIAPIGKPQPVTQGFKVPLPSLRSGGPAEPRQTTPPAAAPPPAAAAPVPASAPPRPATPRPDPVARPPASAHPTVRTAAVPAAPPPGMDEKQSRELFTRYVKARQLVGEKNDDVTYDKLMSSLRKQAPAIMKEHGARGVEFHVVVRGDKVVLKAKPVK